MSRRQIAGAAGAFLLILAAAAGAQQGAKSAQVLMGTAIHQEEVEGDLEAAISTYKSAIAAAGSDRSLAARAQVRIGMCYERLGKAEARKAYEIVLGRYADQAEPVRLARERLEALQGSPAKPKNTEPVVRRLWVPERGQSPASTSPDGRSVLITNWNTGDLWIRDLEAGTNRRLTNGASPADRYSYAEHALFSPDGRLITFNWFNKDGKYDLRIVRFDGSGERIVYTCPAGIVDVYPLDWTPDGRSILANLYRSEVETDLVLIAVGDGSVRTIKPGGKNEETDAQLSQDGRWIAYGKRGGLFLIEVASGKVFPLEEHPADHAVIGWTRDGRSLLFQSDRSGTQDAWMLNVASGKAQGPPEFVKKDIPAWTTGIGSQGTLFYVDTKHRRNVQIAELDPADGKLFAPPRNASRRWTDITISPSWSPDGRSLAYIREGQAKADRVVIVRSTETGEEREMKTRLESLSLFLRWSKDGEALIVEGWDANRRYGLYRVAQQTGETSLLLPLPGLTGYVRADSSPDEKIWYLMTADPESWNNSVLVAKELASGRETVLLKRTGAISVSTSPDGRRLALAAGNEIPRGQSVLVIPAAGGEPRELVRIDPLESNWRVAPKWTPDGRHILFVKGKKGRATSDVQLWRVPAEGGEPERLGLTVDEMWWISPHPDGRRIAFGDWWTQTELWVIENFLPKR